MITLSVVLVAVIVYLLRVIYLIARKKERVEQTLRLTEEENTILRCNVSVLKKQVGSNGPE